MIIKSLKQATKGPLWKFFLSSIGTVIAILLLGKNFFGMTVVESVLLGFGLILLLFYLRFLYFFVKNLIIFIHNSYVDSIWGDAIVDLKNAYAEIHSLRKQTVFDDKEFMKTMIIFCDTLKKIFDRKTKSNCSVSIKVPIVENDRPETIELRNLCRDTYHSERDTIQYMNIKHTIIGNTPYRVIVNNILKQNYKKLAYVNNDIANSKDYDNTSKECYTDGVLPYKSELVYPIIPVKNCDLRNCNISGFICIDCQEKEKFDEIRYDVPMVEGIADGIYDIINMRNQQRN